MRRLCTLLFLVIGISAFSQGNFRFGLHFSPNIGWITPTTNGYEKDGSAANYGFGLNAEFGLGTGENYAVATGIGGTNISGAITAEGASDNFKVNAKYIDLPIAIKLKTNQIGYITYFGKFGLSNGFLVGGKSESGDITDQEFHKEMIPVRSGLLVGVGAEYNISGKTNILVGLDFNNGFTGIFKKDAFQDGAGEDMKIKSKNSFIALSLGVFF
jgi:hypothetical protein